MNNETYFIFIFNITKLLYSLTRMPIHPIKFYNKLIILFFLLYFTIKIVYDNCHSRVSQNKRQYNFYRYIYLQMRVILERGKKRVNYNSYSVARILIYNSIVGSLHYLHSVTLNEAVEGLC